MLLCSQITCIRACCMLVLLAWLPSASAPVSAQLYEMKHPSSFKDLNVSQRWMMDDMNTEHEPRVLSEGVTQQGVLSCILPSRSFWSFPSTLCLPPQLPLFPSLFIASLPLIFLHRSFSALLSRSPPLFMEVMTELPWHMLHRWTSRASRHTPALMHSHTENICWMV